jgi:Tol biopolymer transport system component
MLSGRRAFQRETPAETMTAILKEDPPELSAPSVSASPALQRIVSRCLEKNPAARFHSAGDLAFALDALSGSSASSPHAAPAQTRRSAWIPWVAAIATLMVIAAALWTYTRRPVPGKELIRFTFTLTENWTLDLETDASMPLAVAPDGRAILVRAVDKAGVASLLIRRLEDVEPRVLPGTAGVGSYFWSPDSGSIAFVAGNKIQRLDLAGGPPTTLGEAPDILIGAWSPSGTIILGSYRGLLQVPQNGGTVAPLIPLGQSEAFYSVPQFLSDGRRFTFVVAVGDAVRGGGQRRLMLGSLGTTEQRMLFDTQEFLTPLGLTHGHLLFVRGNAILAQPFDEARMVPLGEAVPIVPRVQLIPNRPYGAASVSATGVLAYVPENDRPLHQLAWFDRAGVRTDVAGELADFSNVELSPDGKSVALSVMDQTRRTRDIWVQDLARGVRTRLTFDPGEERTAVWSRDSARVFYNAQRKNVERDLFSKMSNGSSAETSVLADGLSKDPMDVSPDGRFLLYRVSAKTRNDIWIQPLDGSGKPLPFVASDSNENYARFSPDGRWIAYTGDESGQPQIYVVPFPGPGGKWQVSAAGGSFPKWRGDGRELFYLAPDGKMMSVAVDGTTAAFRSEAPRALFQAPVASFVGYQYAVTKDGRRFLVNTAVPAPLPVTVVSDWTLTLNR